MYFFPEVGDLIQKMEVCLVLLFLYHRQRRQSPLSLVETPGMGTNICIQEDRLVMLVLLELEPNLIMMKIQICVYSYCSKNWECDRLISCIQLSEGICHLAEMLRCLSVVTGESNHLQRVSCLICYPRQLNPVSSITYSAVLQSLAPVFIVLSLFL